MDGLKNEFNLIQYLNKKQYKDVNPIFQEMLKYLFKDIRDNDVIYAKKYGYYAKADAVIEVNGTKKGLSIKMGAKNSVHVEKIDTFCDWLKANGFNNIDELKRYIYSDGTNNNTGINRISSTEYKLNHEKEIQNINKKLNLNPILSNSIYRFLVCSDVNYTVKVDAFMLGSYDDFIWATSEEVLEYLTSLKTDSTGVHVSNLFIQEWNKNLNNNPKYEYCREYIQVKWYSMFDDIIRIMCKRYS